MMNAKDKSAQDALNAKVQAASTTGPVHRRKAGHKLKHGAWRGQHRHSLKSMSAV
jgi:hypothetical protein